MRNNILIYTISTAIAVSTLSINALAEDSAAPAEIPAAAGAVAAPAATAPAAPVMNGPGMNFPLVGSANPLSFDAGPIGKVYVSGAISALGLYQNNPTNASYIGSISKKSTGDISNAQIILQKVDGLVQFYVEAGGYSIPALGTSYLKASKTTSNEYGVIPTAYVKLAPNDTFSIQAGKLPTLFGAEYTFTFENTNIERGLLWNQENVFTRGVQGNYSAGPLAVSVQVTDGFYSKDYNWVTGSVAYTINESNSVSVVAGGNFDKSKVPTGINAYTTPTAQNSGQIYNLIYKYAKGPLTLQPYLQYTYVPTNSALGIPKSTSTYGAALLANYAVNDTINIGARAEYIGSSGNAGDTSQNLLTYGNGSDAWSLTLTPTYQYKGFFVRGETSYVKLSSMTSGLGFGKTGTQDSQSRAMIETGFLF